jgi:hypothetical protein
MYAEDREKAAKRDRAHKENAARAERLLRLAEARQATRGMRVEVDRKWFWDFANDALDTMREASGEAKKRNEQMRAQGIDARIDAACVQLDRIQKRETGR